MLGVHFQELIMFYPNYKNKTLANNMKGFLSMLNMKQTRVVIRQCASFLFPNAVQNVESPLRQKQRKHQHDLILL